MSNENQLKTVNVPLFVQEAINHVPGEYAAQFWDGIYAFRKRVGTHVRPCCYRSKYRQCRPTGIHYGK